MNRKEDFQWAAGKYFFDWLNFRSRLVSYVLYSQNFIQSQLCLTMKNKIIRLYTNAFFFKRDVDKYTTNQPN